MEECTPTVNEQTPTALPNAVNAKNFENIRIKPMIGWKLKDMLCSQSLWNIKWLYLYKNVSMELFTAVN